MNGANAEFQFSAVSFGRCSQTDLHMPTSIAIDPKTDSCWVADYFHGRVMKFKKCSSVAGPPPKASDVLGKPSFVDCFSSEGNNDFSSPGHVSLDVNGTLWVSDRSRVLKFPKGDKTKTGDHHTVQFGEKNSFECSATQFDNTGAIASDASGNLYVAGVSQNRVAVYKNANEKPDRAPFDFVLGQPDSTTCKANNATRTTLRWPQGLAVDPFGTLFVSDIFNYRVMAFLNVATLKNGANADYVIGQPDFNTSGSRIDHRGTVHPYGLTFDTVTTHSLIISDYDANRVLRYCSYTGVKSLPELESHPRSADHNDDDVI
jgi:hypothetical protein